MPHKIISNIMFALTLAVGMLYFSLNEPMPYHKAFLQTDYASLPIMVKEFIMGLIHLVGCIFVGLAVLLKQQSFKIKSDQGKMYCRFLVAMIIFVLFPLQYFTLKVGNGAPWWLVSLLITLCVANIIVIKREYFKSRLPQASPSVQPIAFVSQNQ